jgi:hypothetical protein
MRRVRFMIVTVMLHARVSNKSTVGKRNVGSRASFRETRRIACGPAVAIREHAW